LISSETRDVTAKVVASTTLTLSGCSAPAANRAGPLSLKADRRRLSLFGFQRLCVNELKQSLQRKGKPFRSWRERPSKPASPRRSSSRRCRYTTFERRWLKRRVAAHLSHGGRACLARYSWNVSSISLPVFALRNNHRIQGFGSSDVPLGLRVAGHPCELNP
jgi:hypothetical protein